MRKTAAKRRVQASAFGGNQTPAAEDQDRLKPVHQRREGIMAKADKAVDSTVSESTVENSTGQPGTAEGLVAGDATLPVVADPVPATPSGPIVFNLIAGPSLRYDDQLVGEGEIVAQLTLAPGSPFDARFVTRGVENFLIRVERANQ